MLCSRVKKMCQIHDINMYRVLYDDVYSHSCKKELRSIINTSFFSITAGFTVLGSTTSKKRQLLKSKKTLMSEYFH